MRATVSAAAALVAGIVVSLAPMVAHAHVGVVSGPAFANTSQEITFGVGHGCSGADTLSVKIDIPAGVTSVRAENSDLGKATVTRDAAQNVTSVTWQKASAADLLANDDNYYKLTIRIKVPNQPFTTLYFPAHQTCGKPDGTVLPVVDWVATTQSESDDAGAPEPAPALSIVPARQKGWNKFSVPVALATLSPYLDDALIVWKGTAAYSANVATAMQITGTAGVTALTALAAGDEIWVKY